MTLSWCRVERASTYRVYKRIKNHDDEWNKWKSVGLTTADSYEVKVERGRTFQFKVIGVSKDDYEGKESNIETVRVLGKIRFKFRTVITDIIK